MRLGALGFAVFLLLSGGAVPAAEDPVVARVDGVDIRKTAVLRAYEELPEQYRQLPMDSLLAPLLERVIDDELLRAEAERRGLAEDPAVRAELARARAAVLREALLERVVSEASSPDKLARLYEELKDQPEFQVEEARLSHILVATEEEARAVIEALDAGADFASLARERSTGPSAAQGGDLGWVQREQLVTEFSAAAFALAPGEYTRTPVQTRFGWHVIRLEDKRSTVPAFEEVEGELRLQVARAAIRALLESLREGATIERFPEALTAGGEE